MTKKKVILGSEECGTCYYVEGYIEDTQDDDMVYMKVKPSSPSSDKILKMMEKMKIEIDAYPFCLEISDNNNAEVCDADALISELQKWYDKLDSKNK